MNNKAGSQKNSQEERKFRPVKVGSVFGLLAKTKPPKTENLRLAPEVPHDDHGDERGPQARGDRPKRDGLDVEKLIAEIRGLGAHSQQLVEAFTKILPENGGSLGRAESAIAAAAPEPSLPYPLWKERPPGRGANNPARWIETYHSDLIGTDGARAELRHRDHGLYSYYAKWIDRHPEDNLKLDTRPVANLEDMSAVEVLSRKRGQLRAADTRYRQRKIESL